MRFRSWFAIILLTSTTSTFAQDIDKVLEIVRPERTELAKCFLETLPVVEKHRLVRWLYPVLEAACAVEIERVKTAIGNQFDSEFMKLLAPGQVVLGMLENTSEVYKGRQPVSSCSGTGCSLDEYRTCLMHRMPAAVRARSKLLDFENLAQQHCENFESAARSALTNDLDKFTGGVNHRVNDVIGKIIVRIREDVVVLYAEDLVKVQPGRKSCKPEMCGASPCLSLVEKPTEYQCVINQK